MSNLNDDTEAMSRPIKGMKVRIYKPGMPDDGMSGRVNGAGSEGAWVVDVYTSPTFYSYGEIYWDADTLAKCLIVWARAGAPGVIL